MTFDEKVKIAATARSLIYQLEDCDDKDFVKEVLASVGDGEVYPCINPAYFT